MAYLAATKIDLAANGAVSVQWNDGHTGIYPFRYLRAQCSCAYCKHEWTGKRLVLEDQIDPNVYPMAVTPVGRYGVALTWNDGHKAGIYTFDNLRAMCQCFDCSGKEPVLSGGPLFTEAPDVSAADLQAFLDRGKEKAAGGGGCGSGSCGCKG